MKRGHCTVMTIISMQTPNLKTERLTLRPIALSDQQDIFQYASNPIFGYRTPWRTHETLQDTERYIQQQLALEKDNAFIWGVTLADENRVIGTIQLTNYSAVHNRAKLSFILSEDYWAQGIMAEAGEAVVHFAFQQLHIHKIIAECFIENHRTHRVLQKLGMELEGIAKKHFWLNDHYHDVILYALFSK